GISQVTEPEEIFNAPQEGVVIVRRVVDRAGADVLGDQDGPDAAATGSGDAGRRRLGAGRLGATGGAVGVAAGYLTVIEANDQQTVAAERARREHQRHPLLEQEIGWRAT